MASIKQAKNKASNQLPLSTRYLNRIYVDICVMFWIQLRYPKDTKFEKKMRKLTIDYSLVTFYDHL